jgi:hypothetical protein
VLRERDRVHQGLALDLTRRPGGRGHVPDGNAAVPGPQLCELALDVLELRRADAVRMLSLTEQLGEELRAETRERVEGAALLDDEGTTDGDGDRSYGRLLRC